MQGNTLTPGEVPLLSNEVVMALVGRPTLRMISLRCNRTAVGVLLLIAENRIVRLHDAVAVKLPKEPGLGEPTFPAPG